MDREYSKLVQFLNLTDLSEEEIMQAIDSYICKKDKAIIHPEEAQLSFPDGIMKANA